jgi:hypothetical protein
LREDIALSDLSIGFYGCNTWFMIEFAFVKVLPGIDSVV